MCICFLVDYKKTIDVKIKSIFTSGLQLLQSIFIVVLRLTIILFTVSFKVRHVIGALIMTL